MTLNIVILLLRIGIIVLLFFFLFQVFLLIRSDLRAVRPQRVLKAGDLRVLETAASNLSKGELLPLLGINSLGRNPNSTLPLFDESVSGDHLILRFEDGIWKAEDLGSTNGTFVNGHKLLRSSALAYGDVIQVGRTKLRLERPSVDLH